MDYRLTKNRTKKPSLQVAQMTLSTFTSRDLDLQIWPR